MKSLRLYLFLLSLLVALFVGYQKLNERLEADGEGQGKLGEGGRHEGEGADGRGDFSDEGVVPEARSTTRKHPEREKSKRIRTDSGLIYQVIKEGHGVRPGPEDNVKVMYRGYLQNGEEFDGTVAEQSISFPLRGVIKGWSEGLQLMRVGAKYRFIIPPELAYGAKGVPSRIGPNETLVFEVELVGIK